MKINSDFRILPKNNSVQNINKINGLNSLFLNFVNTNFKESSNLMNNIRSKKVNNEEQNILLLSIQYLLTTLISSILQDTSNKGIP